MNKYEDNLSNFDEVADAIWLLSQVMRFDKRINLSKYIPQDVHATDLPPAGSPLSPPIIKEPITESGVQGIDSIPIYINNKEQSTRTAVSGGASVNFAFTVPKPISSLEIQRALRPLKIKVPSRSLPLQVNVDASLYQMAKNELANQRRSVKSPERLSLWQNVPVFQLGKEKWLDLVFIVDATGPLMKLFENRIALLQRAIMESGIFHHVSEYYLKISSDGSPDFHKLYGSQPCALSEILGATERKVFWFITDCGSNLWDNWELNKSGQIKSIGDVFNKISDFYPAAIVQLMPEELWSRTGLSLHELCKVWATAPLLPNKNIQTSVLQDPQDGFAIPVLSLSAQRLSPWADMVAGRVTDKAVLSVFIRRSKKQRDKRPLVSLLEREGYGAVLDVFGVTVPRQARLYAAYLSVLPTMSFEELLKLSKKITPLLSEDELMEIVSNLTSSKLYNFILEPEERIVSELDTKDRKSIRSAIPYSKQLEIMAEFYDSEIVPKFLDSNGNGIDFWLFVSKNIEVSNLGEKRVKETYDVFQDILVRNKGEEPAFRPIIEMDESEQVDGMKINPVNNYDQKYLELEYSDISFWGEKGCGKTSMLLSMPRQGVLDGYIVKRVDHYGNLIPSKHTHAITPQASPTIEEEDYLYYLEGYPGSTGNKLLCFHDFPGAHTTLLTSTAKISYKHSDAIFLCLEAEKLWSENALDKQLKEDFYEFLNWLDLENVKPYIAVCLTKTDIVQHRNEETFNNLSPWSLMERFLGKYAVSILHTRSAEVFSLSAWGTKSEWTPRKVFTPVEGFLKKTL